MGHALLVTRAQSVALSVLLAAQVGLAVGRHQRHVAPPHQQLQREQQGGHGLGALPPGGGAGGVPAKFVQCVCARARMM